MRTVDELTYRALINLMAQERNVFAADCLLSSISYCKQFREIIQVFVGQAGCQIGDACWELYALEHNVDPNGDFITPVNSEQEIFELSTFFNETPAHKAAPRTLLIDSEPSVLGRHTKTNGERKQKPEIRRAMPYVSDFSEATERMLRPLTVGLAHGSEAPIRRLLMQPKGRLPAENTSAVVYRVNCLDCLVNNRGMTDKRLRSGMHECTLAVKRKDGRSHVTMHNLENNHPFSFDRAQVVDRAETENGERDYRGLAIGRQLDQP
ncbi:unnamed protein product [Schistocephalus solidus]|uniref:Tubulin domain-containing protein n=1 Tax=Schistocephalus solidus TaxID=70667 RepID=A0A183TJK5_SCHSO|nr:unnamed protein product [Schistocephalus solidus]